MKKSKHARAASQSEEIDREYIEGETLEEIGKIGEQRGIPDKSEREPTGIEKEARADSQHAKAAKQSRKKAA